MRVVPYGLVLVRAGHMPVNATLPYITRYALKNTKNALLDVYYANTTVTAATGPRVEEESSAVFFPKQMP